MSEWVSGPEVNQLELTDCGRRSCERSMLDPGWNDCWKLNEKSVLIWANAHQELIPEDTINRKVYKLLSGCCKLEGEEV